MKTRLIIVAICMFISPAVFSQSFTIGIKGGANLNKLTGKSFKDEFSFGYHIGGYVAAGGAKLYVQPEVLFNQVNQDTASDFSQIYQFRQVDKIKLNYLTIPILLGYRLNKVVSLQVGPQFGILLDQNKDLLQNGEDAFKSGGFSLVGGIQLGFSKVNVYGRYVGGMTNLDNVGDKDSWKLNAIQLGIGIGF
ncbi:MAG: porin family protein [Ginsengibacter sp.]